MSEQKPKQIIESIDSEQTSEQQLQLDRIAALREDIDEIDRSLIALLESRLELCRTLAHVKSDSGFALRSIEREQQVLSQLTELVQDPHLQTYLPQLYALIFKMNLETQEDILSQPHKERESGNIELDQDVIRDRVHSLVEESHELVPQTTDLKPKRTLGKRLTLIRRNLGRLRWRKDDLANAPRSAPLSTEQRTWLTKQGFAHRGFHDALQNIPENSLPAFELAIKHNYGIELDVHLSKDGVAMVFHDEEMTRMTGYEGEIKEYTCAELKSMQLIPGHSFIPTLAEVLTCINGRVPVLVEVKNYGHPVGPLEQAIADDISNYVGPLAIQSFNPMSLKWFYRHCPNVIRGLIAYSFPVEEVPMKATTRFLLKNLLFTPLCKPHYIAYEHQDLANHRLRRLHRMRVRGTPVLVWTVRSQEHADLALKRADNIIFEGFHPHKLNQS